MAFTYSTISDFGNRIVIHKEGTDPNNHENNVLSLGDAWLGDPISAEVFASNLVDLLNRAQNESQ